MKTSGVCSHSSLHPLISFTPPSAVLLAPSGFLCSLPLFRQWAGSSCLPWLGRQLAVAVAPSSRGRLSGERRFCWRGRAGSKGSRRLGYFSFFIPVVSRNAAGLPLSQTFHGQWSKKGCKKSSRGTVSSAVFMHFVLAVYKPILGLGWGSYVWCSCVYYSCIFALHLFNQTETVMYQKAEICVYPFSVYIQCSC